MHETCMLSYTRCATLFALWTHESPNDPGLAEILEEARRGPLESLLTPKALSGLAALFGPDATAGRPPSFELASDLSRTYGQHYHHGAPFPASSLHAAWERCAQSDERCRARVEHVQTLGLGRARLSKR